MADRRCPIFFLRLQKMNNTRSENKYKYFCTSDPKLGKPMRHPIRTGLGLKTAQPGEILVKLERDRGRGRLGGYKRGDGGGTQWIPDKGWEWMKLGMRTEGNKLNGSIQIEGHNHGNVTSIENGSRDRETVKAWQSGGRKYKKGIQKESGGAQTMLNKFWIGKEKDM